MKEYYDIPKEYMRACAVVDLACIKYNLDLIHGKLSPDTKLLAVVKTDGYGHGAIPVARAVEPLDYVAGLAVATPEEAMELRQAGIRKSILILGYVFPYAYPDMIRQDVRMSVYRKDQIDAIDEAAAALGVMAKVHIKLDTAMHRIGIRPDEAGFAFVKACLAKDHIVVEGIHTHFAKADEPDKEPAKAQFAAYQEFIARVENELNYPVPIKHCCNSAGALSLPEAQLDMVRVGIAMYGVYPDVCMREEALADAKESADAMAANGNLAASDVTTASDATSSMLRPALSLISHIVMVKDIPAGAQISYGGTFTAPRPMTIATIPIGYGDGYPRSLSNKGYVLIHGQKAPILGRVCMDQFMVDVSHIQGVAEGDEVVLVGCQGEEQITLEAIGSLSGRFHYEFACDLGRRIPRLYP